jgi:hypothetical protein
MAQKGVTIVFLIVSSILVIQEIFVTKIVILQY